ncbi:MAG TPA: trimethylamine methyltransferase family protein [Terriglobia bacterium]|nr:trimethylamine methyltransferase family protein [Terriglobia bacterium]
MKTSALEPLRYLSRKEMDSIHHAALRILERTGMWIDHVQALEYLRAAGCQVDMDRRIVKFPAECVEGAVARMRRNFQNPDRWPKRLSVRYSQVRFDTQPLRIHEDFTVSSGGFCCFIWDLEGERRYATLQDVRQSLQLADQLDQIAYTGLPCAAQDVPVEIRPVMMAAELVKATRKYGGIETFQRKDVGYVTRIGEIVAGSREAHRRDPILVGYAEARTPLCIDAVMADVMLAHLELGLPQSLDTMPNGGATAPMSTPAVLALGMAETLGGLVLGYAVDPDATMTIDVTPGFCDMRAMQFRSAGGERMPLLAARVQLISEYYGCPSGAHAGKSDACVPGIQAAVEKSISMYVAVMAGAIGFGTVGQLENMITFSPLQLAIDNEMARYVRHSIRGFEVNPESLALEIIEELGHGGHAYDHSHTVENFRKLQTLSPYFDVCGWGMGDSLDRERFEMRAAAQVRKALATESAPALTPDQEAAIDEVVKEAAQDCKVQVPA